MTGFAIVTALLLRTASPEIAPEVEAVSELRDPFSVERPVLRAAKIAPELRDPFAARRPVEAAAPSAGRITDPFASDTGSADRALVDPFAARARAGSRGAPAGAQLADPFAHRAVKAAPVERADPFEARADGATKAPERAVVDPWGR